MNELSKMVLVVAVITAAAACNKSGAGDSCDALAQKLCEGKDAAYCTKTRSFLDDALKAPDGKALDDKQKVELCKGIADRPASFASYKRKVEATIN